MTLLKTKGLGYSGLIAALFLSACQQSGGGFPGLLQQKPEPVAVKPVAKPKPVLSAKVVGQKAGNGPNRIALLVPMGAQGPAGRVGREIANAAKLAVRDFGANRLQIVIKDTKGQAAQASIAAVQARDEGASLVLGPLFSASVGTSSGVTKPAGIPMIAFSSDIARAQSGNYLLSFPPDSDISRTLNYGISLGANRVVALLPNTAYGTLVEREMRRVMGRSGGEVVSVVRYANTGNAMITAARAIALPLTNANAIYIPDGGQAPALMLNALRKAGVSLAGKQVMGSGQWESVDAKAGVLNGAIYAGADKRNFENFARRYSATYGSRPTITAALGYDAVSLAATLVNRNAQSPFTNQAIESRGGFNGATGLFRFEKNGRIQRGLVVNKIENGNRTVVSPAPSSFGGQG